MKHGATIWQQTGTAGMARWEVGLIAAAAAAAREGEEVDQEGGEVVGGGESCNFLT